MAWNTSPEVAVARDVAGKFKAEQVVILYIRGEQFGYASYGATAALCAQARRIADVAYDAVEQLFAKGG